MTAALLAWTLGWVLFTRWWLVRVEGYRKAAPDRPEPAEPPPPAGESRGPAVTPPDETFTALP